MVKRHCWHLLTTSGGNIYIPEYFTRIFMEKEFCFTSTFGAGFCSNWLDHKNYVNIGTLSIRLNTSFGSLMVLLFIVTNWPNNVNNLMNFTHIRWQNQVLRCKYKQKYAFFVTSWGMKIAEKIHNPLTQLYIFFLQ